MSFKTLGFNLAGATGGVPGVIPAFCFIEKI
jgi:hypothetical protein